MYDTTMTMQAMKTMYFAPILYCLLGSVFLSNQQIFNDIVTKENDLTALENTAHTFETYFTIMTPGTPLLIVGITLLVLRIIKMFEYFSYENRMASKLNMTMQEINDSTVVEEQHEFIDTLTNESKSTWSQEELVSIVRLNTRTINEDLLKSL